MSEWTWTPERERCLELYLVGWPKLRIAKELGVNRNTVTDWCGRAEFQARARELQAEHVEATRQRRQRETNQFADRLSMLAAKALEAAMKDPKHVASRIAARDWLSEFRAFRAEERHDTGDDVQRHQVLGVVQHQHSQMVSQSFRGFLEKALEAGAIDVDAVELSDPQLMVADLARQALLDSDVLDELAVTDTAADE